MLALPIPEDGEQRGGLSVIYDVADYLFFAARAQEFGIPDYGDITILPAPVRPPVLTPFGSGLLDAPVYYVDPPTGVVVNYSKKLIVEARAAGSTLNYFYAGKYSIYGPTPRDPTSWDSDTMQRFRTHKLAAAGYKFAVVVAIYSGEDAALETERCIARELGDATGMTCLNTFPVTTGKRSQGKGTGFAVYIQAR